MFDNSLAIQNPFGISVYGSAVLKVSPDSASIAAAVKCLEDKPEDAFAGAKSAARSVAEFLDKSELGEFSASRISIMEHRRFLGGENHFLGCQAMVGFTIVLRSLDRLEEIVTGVLHNGCNEIVSIAFETSELQEHRKKVRELAIASARDKALLYAAAAGVELGKVIHIQDLFPHAAMRPRGAISQFFGSGPTAPKDAELEAETTRTSLDPGAVEVRADVALAFSIK
jgi:hypothetical protein